MKKIVHNKLVRDHIPEIIEEDQKQCKTHVLNNEEYIVELKKKLGEEAREVQEAVDKIETIKEIADVLEVLDALKTVCGISDEEVQVIKEKKAMKNGKFEKKIFLEYVLEDIDK